MKFVLLIPLFCAPFLSGCVDGKLPPTVGPVATFVEGPVCSTVAAVTGVGLVADVCAWLKPLIDGLITRYSAQGIALSPKLVDLGADVGSVSETIAKDVTLSAAIGAHREAAKKAAK